MKLLFLLLLLPSLLFKPDAVEEQSHIKETANGIFKVKPPKEEQVNVPNTDKQVYNLISNTSFRENIEHAQ